MHSVATSQTSTTQLRTARAFALAVGLGASLLGSAGLTGCAAESSESEYFSSEELVGADDSHTGEAVEGETSEAITARYLAGTRVRTTTGVNLRRTPTGSGALIIVMPQGSILTLAENPGPTGGWYRVRYGAYTGYASGQFLALAPASTGGGTAPSGGGTAASVRGAGIEAGFARARAGVGFSYWWGHGRWLATGVTEDNAGVCRGGCPSCSHSGSYGADCSGYVAKIWNAPSTNTDISDDSHPYSTESFYSTTGGGQWSRISRGNIERGDAMVYRSGSQGHIVLFESGDAWGASWVFESRGCSTGVVHNVRTIPSNYVAIRRSGW